MSDLIPNNPNENTPLQEPVPSRPFYEIWWRAFTRPSVQTYAEIARSPHASTTNAILWVLITSMVQLIPAVLANSAMQRIILRELGQAENLPVSSGTDMIFGFICGVPAGAVVMLLMFLLVVGVAQLIARAFGGTGTFGQLAYTFAAIWAPFALIATLLVLLEAVPGFGLALICVALLLSLLLSIYYIVLEIMAVKAVHAVGWGGAVTSILVWPIIVFLCACAVIVALMASGEAIGNVFSSINQSLQTVP